MILSLAGLSTTINIELQSSNEEYNPTPILQIDKEGPQAKKVPVYSVQPIPNDEILKKLVLGIAPPDFVKLKSSDPQVEGGRIKKASCSFGQCCTQ